MLGQSPQQVSTCFLFSEETKMDKAKTSGKRGFSFGNMPKVSLKPGRAIHEYDPSKRLKDPQVVLRSLMECLEQGDPEAFKEILGAYLQIINKDAFARRAGISRRSLFRMLSPAGNPTLDHVAKVVAAIRKAA